MAAYIRPNRREVTRQFPILGFTVHSGPHPAWFEVALATDPTLLDAAGAARRTQATFYSSRAEGALRAEGRQTVYFVPPPVLARFAGQDRLYYALALYRQPDLRRPEIVRLPAEARAYVTISKSFDGRTRGITGMPNPRGGLTGPGYDADAPVHLTWGGDSASLDVVQPTGPPGGDGAATAPPQPAPEPPTPHAQAFAYDDGLDPSFWARARQASSESGTRSPQPTRRAAMNTPSLTYPHAEAPYTRERSAHYAREASAVGAATWVIDKILGNEGDISWTLDKMKGLKHPDNDTSKAGSSSYQSKTLTVPGPRVATVAGLDEIYADCEIDFQFNGTSLGNIQIAVTKANDAAGAGLVVTAEIMEDANLYTTKPPSNARFVAMKIRIHYRFTNLIWGDVIAIRDMVLYGNGSWSDRWRWTQRP